MYIFIFITNLYLLWIFSFFPQVFKKYIVKEDRNNTKEEKNNNSLENELNILGFELIK